MSEQHYHNPITTAALKEARTSLAALELPEPVWREHKGVVETAISRLVEDHERLRVALIYLRDAVWDEIQPTEGDHLHALVMEANTALAGGSPVAPAGTLADGHIWPTDFADGEKS